MTLWSRRAVFGLAAVPVALTTSWPWRAAVASDDITAAEDGARKINLAGRQRMLSQYMAKAACFVKLGVDVPQHKQQMAEGHFLFDQCLEGLRDGSPLLGMLPEKNPKIREELQSADKLWAEYGRAVTEWQQKGPSDSGAFPTITTLNAPLLEQMHKTTNLIQEVYGAASGGTVDPGIAVALNVSGRQRMLSQKASKEFCLVALGVEPEENRARLKATVAEFSGSLKALIEGDPARNIPEAPVSAIKEQLETVGGIWRPLETILRRAAEGGQPTPADIQTVASDNIPLLKEMNAAVWLYETTQ